jgi:hydroxymethylbilane synthase
VEAEDMRAIRIATRASKLALVQSEYVRKLLRGHCSGADISLVKITTKGDRDKTDFLHEANSVGFFTTEVENALLDGRADIAVHSFKDLPTAITSGLMIAAIPKRESVADALVVSGPVTSLKDLPEGTTVGTSSLRRMAQIRHIRSDLKCVPLRGNVETRVNKVIAGQIDGIVIACAGLNRLGLSGRISEILPPEKFMPAPAQGALAIQIRSDDNELAELVSQLDDAHSRVTAQTEREILSAMHGGCSIPLGVYSRIQDDSIKIDAMICDLEGRDYIKRTVTCPVARAKTCAEELAKELLNAGGREILDRMRAEKND